MFVQSQTSDVATPLRKKNKFGNVLIVPESQPHFPVVAKPIFQKLPTEGAQIEGSPQKGTSAAGSSQGAQVLVPKQVNSGIKPVANSQSRNLKAANLAAVQSGGGGSSTGSVSAVSVPKKSNLNSSIAEGSGRSSRQQGIPQVSLQAFQIPANTRLPSQSSGVSSVQKSSSPVDSRATQSLNPVAQSRLGAAKASLVGGQNLQQSSQKRTFFSTAQAQGPAAAVQSPKQKRGEGSRVVPTAVRPPIRAPVQQVAQVSPRVTASTAVQPKAKAQKTVAVSQTENLKNSAQPRAARLNQFTNSQLPRTPAAAQPVASAAVRPPVRVPQLNSQNLPSPSQQKPLKQVTPTAKTAALKLQSTGTQKPTAKQVSTFQQFWQSNQKATGSFVRNIFGSTQKKSAQPSTQDLRESAKIYQQGLASIHDLIAPSSLDIQYDHLKLSGVYERSFFVYAYPRFLETNWLTSIINFDATLDISQFIYPISSAEIMRTLKKKVAQIQSSITIAREKGNVRDPEMETALEDAEQLRNDLQRGQEKFFQLGFYFTVYAEDEKRLEALTKQLESLLGSRLVLTKRADIRGEHAFNSTLPLAIDELEVQRNMNTSPLSTTFPFVSSDLATDEGILYGLNRHNNSLIIFDRFKLPNANESVFATSGSGKSYAVKLEILRQLMLGTEVIVVDPEDEYKKLAEAVGGKYLRVSLTSDQRINPFDLPQTFEGQDLKAGDLLRENIIALTGLLKLMLGKMSPAEEALIDEGLIETYAVRGITLDIQNPGRMPVPTMEDFHSVLKSLRGAEGLAMRLQRFTTGTFGGIFNQTTNIDLRANSGLLVFCIRDLGEELRPIAMYILLNFIWNRVRSQLKKRLLVVDEAWNLMQHEDAARFLYGLVKRARKYYLGITTITQDVEDFLGSPFGRPIVANSALQLLLKQAPSSMEMLRKTFNLTEGEKYMLLNSGLGQGLFFADNKHVAIQVIACDSEHKIITTNPEEILARRR